MSDLSRVHEVHRPNACQLRTMIFEKYKKSLFFEMVDVGLFEPGSNDFSRQIAAFRDSGCDIMTGLFDPPDWVVFWRQAMQAAAVGIALDVATGLAYLHAQQPVPTQLRRPRGPFRTWQPH